MADTSALRSLPRRRTRRHPRLVGWHTFVSAAAAMVEAADEGRQVAVFLCRVDDYRVLDGCGPSEANGEVLTAAAERMCSVSSDAVVARTGWDEFAMAATVAAGCGSVLAAVVVATGADALTVGDSTVAVDLSVGASILDPASPITAALRSARAAMESGRGATVGGRAGAVSDDAAAGRRRRMADQVAAALAGGAITAHFQPQVCLRHGTVVGFEALARWEGTDFGPAEFVPVVEAQGLGDRLTAMVLGRACTLIEAALARTGRAPMVSVNISPEQLDDPGLESMIEEVLSAYDVPRRSLCLELTESQQLPTTARALGRLESLKALGVSLAIDDFGAGYSGFAYLTHFPIDYLKLDRVLVTGLHDDLRRMVTARAVIGLARTLGITVVAEGVEDCSDSMSLVDLNCHLGQGWLWGAAEPMEAALDRLAADRGQRAPGCACSDGDPDADGDGFTVVSPEAAAMAQLIALERSRAGSFTRLFDADPVALVPLKSRAWREIVAELSILEDRSRLLAREMADNLRSRPARTDAYRFVGESIALAVSRRQRLEILHGGLEPDGLDARPSAVIRLQALVGEALHAETRADAVRESVIRLLTRPGTRPGWAQE